MRQVAMRWFEGYCKDFGLYEAAAELARMEIVDALSGSKIGVHSVTCRAKHPASVRHKIENGDLGQPKRQLKDLIGVRVITTFAHGVDPAATRLESRFPSTVRIDKRGLLDVHRFGYRSVHLHTALDRVAEISDAADLLRNSVIEIQVRSVIEHAWAEIEHDLRYKSGVDMPDPLARRFSALAGALELVDREFDALHSELVALVRAFQEEYVSTPASGHRLDSARLSGLVAARRPLAAPTGPRGLPMPLPDAARLVAQLESLGIVLDGDLDSRLQEQSLLIHVRNYADSQKVDPTEVSAFAVVGLIVLAEAMRLGLAMTVSTDPTLEAALSP